jgi:hypothetical protein
MLFYICSIAAPSIASLQRYAVAYGYEGRSKKEALQSARGVFVIVALIVAVNAAIH